MAIKAGTKYVIIPIEEGWSNFRIEYCGSDISIMGYDGKTLIGSIGYFGVTENSFEEVFLIGIEQTRSNFAFFDIFNDDARDEDGNRYLILARTEEK